MPSTAELAYLAAYDASQFPRPSVTVDVVLIALDGDALRTLLVRRTEQPQKGRWSFPGGFVRIDESLDDAAARVLRDKAGIDGVFLEQLYTFGAPERDPRTRVISVAYYGLVDHAALAAAAASLGEHDRVATFRVPWEGERGGPVDLLDAHGKALSVAFDHRDIAGTAIKRLRGKLAYTPVGFALLPREFTLLQLQRVHEIVLGTRLNKDSFRRRMLASDTLETTGTAQEGVDHRPAALYRRRETGDSFHG